MVRAAVRIALAMCTVLSIALAPPAHAAATRVSGIVVDAETQKPIANADVELQNSGGGPGYHRAHTDTKGSFTIENVTTNRWYLFTVGAEGYADWALESWQFPSGQNDVSLTVPLDKAGSLDIRVTGAAKAGVNAARVRIRSERSSSWWESSRRDPEPRYTGKDGRVVFTGLSAGEYTVQVEAAGLRADEARLVPVRRGEVSVVPVTMTRPASLAGQVKLADSTGVAGVNVIARGPGEATATTDASGYYALGDLGPGRWRIEVQHDGFEPGVARDGVVLAEGQSRDKLDMTVRPKPQSFAFVLQREVFAPDDKQSVGLRAFRIAQIAMTVYRVPAARLLDAKKDYRAAYVSGTDTTGLERVQSWTHRLPDGAPFAWREQDMKLPQELPAGAYVLVGRAGTMQRRQMFFVSDLSLLVKRSAGQTLVWAGSIKTGLPLKGVAVFAGGSASSNSTIEAGNDWSSAVSAARTARMVTDADGLLVFPSGTTQRSRIIAVTDDHGVAVAESPLSGAAKQGGDAMFLFTERPIYRPGQTVYWKLFARRAQGDAYAMPDQIAATLKLAGPDGSELDVTGKTLSASGAADGSVTIPADAPLGDYTLSADAGNAHGSATLAVQQYRKPEYKVDVTSDQPVYVNGDEVRFRVAANYFFGAAVVGATVRYTLFETRLHPEELRAAEDGGEGEEGGGESSAGFGRMLESGETRTDVDGRVQLTFTPQRVAYDRRLSLEVEVVDASQREVSSRGSAIVGRGLFTLAITPVSPLFMAGQPLVFDVSTLDHTGKPVSAAVTLELDQDVWNPLERRYTRSSRALATSNAVTSTSQGFARITVSPAVARSGYLTIRAHADDARGNRITAESSFWDFDSNVWEYAYRYPSLEALPDKAEYAAGDTARILVNTDQRDASLLVSVEGRDLHEYKIQHLFGNTGLVKVVMQRTYAPNVFVALHVRRGREVHSRVLELKVKAESHDLAITLTPDRGTYRPQDRARIAVETRDAAGKPVSAEVALGVVDESIYSLRADQTPDPRDVFYGRRANWVTTVVSFPTLYYGGADKGDHNEPRKDFRDVALWAPVVRTGADGRAEVSLQYPDNLTTWRATARGVSDATLVGTAVSKTLVTKDVVARLAVPRNFIAGDQATLVSVTSNRTSQPLTGVSEALQIAGAGTLVGATSATTSMPAGGESRSLWNVAFGAESPKDGSDARATFTFRARAKADQDALEQSVPVLPRAVALPLSGAGALEAASSAEKISMPADLVRSGSELALELSPSPAALALAALESLMSYDYLCTEQTANRILPATALLAAASQAKVMVPGWDDPQKRLTPAIERLFALRSNEGAWGWWNSSESDPYMSALAIDALASAAAAGIQRDACLSTIEQSQYAVGRLFQDVRSADGEAYCAMHFSSLMTVPELGEQLKDLRALIDANARSLSDRRKELGISGLACAAIALQRTGHTAEARELLDAMLTHAVRTGTVLSLPGDPDAGWYGDATENTAYGLLALATISPADTRAEAMMRSLARERHGRGWRTTRASGIAAQALATYLLAHPADLTAPGHVSARWNGAALFDGAIAKNAFAPGITLHVSGAQLRAGDNDLSLTRDGAGTLYWAWSAKANVPSPGPVTADARLSVRREYLHASRTADRRGRARWLVTPVTDKDPIRVGEEVLVRLTLEAKKALDHCMLEDPKPAGFEIDQVLPDGADRPWDTAAEARDDRAVFFVGALDEGTTVLEYLIRPELSGTFTALPASTGPMYDPGLLVRSGEQRLVVVAKP
jgi:hypothetical protein